MQIPVVVKDHNSKTAIITRMGRKYAYVVFMKSGKLTLGKLTPVQIQNKAFKTLAIDTKTAVDQFLAHSGGLTQSARLELEAVKEGLHETDSIGL